MECLSGSDAAAYGKKPQYGPKPSRQSCPFEHFQICISRQADAIRCNRRDYPRRNESEL